MIKLLFAPSQILTIDTAGKHQKNGNEFSDVNTIDEHSVVVEDDIIKDIIPNSSVKKNSFDAVLDLKDKIVLPGLIECHTHTTFTGSRADEFSQRLEGADYEMIAKSGGGINSTVKSVRNSSFEEIVDEVKPRIENFIAQGITTLEIKSGYGLDFENEIKLLHVINYLNEIYAIDIIPTFLGAHTYPPEYTQNHEQYLNLITNKMLPHISKQKLAKFCDGFCEATAYSAEEIKSIFLSANANGLKLKLHTEQFNSIGGLDVALNLNAVSVDHLEVLKDDDIQKIADSDTVAVVLPGVSFFLNHQYAPVRKLIDKNVVVALATDFNPGSSHISSLGLIMSIAAIKMNMSIEETINAVTINAAKALCVNDKVGSIEIGKKADFSVFDSKEYANIVYHIGNNLNCITIKNGRIIYNYTEQNFN